MTPSVAPFKVLGSIGLHRWHVHEAKRGVWEDFLKHVWTKMSPEGPGGVSQHNGWVAGEKDTLGHSPVWVKARCKYSVTKIH